MQELIKGLVVKNNSKIVLLVMDGVGGLPREDGRTELEAAATPNLDALARRSACGLHLPVDLGITPGSGPGHLALFGYDPKTHQIGRGILEALGLGLHVEKTDIAIRCNYSTMRDNTVTDRRAGRIPTALSKKLTERLQAEIRSIDEAEVIFAPGMEHRFAVILRFPQELEQGSADLNDTDPQKEGKAPLPLQPATPQAEKVARVAEKLVARASELLEGEEKANHILLRGFSQKPDMPSFEEAYGLKALAVSVYPMYRGVARLVGMDAPYLEGDIPEEVDFLKKNLEDYDFFFVHVKKVDSHGEDGDFDAKARKIEEVDKAVPEILGLDPDVLVVTGDHCTPAVMGSHSWHPVPVLLRSRYVLGGLVEAFSERQCRLGELGVFPTKALMPLALANAGRLKKFGA
ncbi:MAG: 2,3-bisphosphoglycerate-independent phosphoglycerate mutase [Thermodesulfovibrionales bacterium]